MSKRLSPTPSVWFMVLLLVMWKLLLLYANAPFLGHHDANGIWLGAAARNLRIDDIGAVGLVPQLSRGPVPPDTPNYYVHHPPLVVWLTALAESAFGDHELSLRLVSIFSTMIAVSGFFVFCRRLYDTRMGLLCAALYALTPMMVYFGRMPDHEPLALAFLTLFLAAYVNWIYAPARKRWFLMAAMGFLGIWTAWADFFFVMLVAFTGLWAVKRSQRGALVALGGVGLLAVASIVALYRLEYPATINDLLDAFIWRTSTISEISTTFTWFQFAGQILIYLIAGATLALLVLFVPGVILAWRDQRPLNRMLLLALAASGLAYLALFRSASYVHDYYAIFLVPLLAITGAHACTGAATNLRWQRLTRPALSGVFLTSTIAAVLFMSRWYSTDYQPFELQFARWLDAHTQPDDLVVTNIPTANPPVEYYAFRKIIWGAPDSAPLNIQAGTTPVVYVNCPWINSEQRQRDLTGAQKLEACRVERLP